MRGRPGRMAAESGVLRDAIPGARMDAKRGALRATKSGASPGCGPLAGACTAAAATGAATGGVTHGSCRRQGHGRRAPCRALECNCGRRPACRCYGRALDGGVARRCDRMAAELAHGPDSRE